MDTTKVDPKTKEPGVSARDARRATGRAKEKVRIAAKADAVAKYFGHRHYDREVPAEERDKQYVLPGG